MSSAMASQEANVMSGADRMWVTRIAEVSGVEVAADGGSRAPRWARGMLSAVLLLLPVLAVASPEVARAEGDAGAKPPQASASEPRPIMHRVFEALIHLLLLDRLPPLNGCSELV